LAAALLFRVDSGSQMGAGHAMRCLALAQAAQEVGYETLFASAEVGSGVRERLTSEGVRHLPVGAELGSASDARSTAAAARDIDSDWVILDGYQFNADYQQQLKDAGLKVFAIDDYGHAGRYVADVVLNQNLHASTDMYTQRAGYTQLLLGPKYVLLRREFRKARPGARQIATIARRILVTMGGADPQGMIVKTVRALARIDIAASEAVVVIGLANQASAAMTNLAEATPAIRLERAVTDMAALMAWADIAIAAAGTTVWELLYSGLPSLLVVTADNQQASAEAVAAEGLGVNLGWSDQVSEESMVRAVTGLSHDRDRRALMTERAAALIDGAGVHRVLAYLRGKTNPIILRDITPASGFEAKPRS
jgi:UDP-2,4-diacetamido-2,4,6-trideoxy-beta-L-altropyranose hydrolase